MSIPFGSNASLKNCCYQYLLPPLHHTVWCARGQTVNQFGKLMQAKYHHFFARLLLIQISSLIRSSIQLLQQQHQHTQRGGAESKQMSTKDSSKPSSSTEGSAHRNKNRGQLGPQVRVQSQSTPLLLQKYKSKVNTGTAHLDSAH